MWLSWLDIIPQTEMLLLGFLVRAYAWVASGVLGWACSLVMVHAEGTQLTFLSCIVVSLLLSSSLPSPLYKLNK